MVGRSLPPPTSDDFRLIEEMSGAGSTLDEIALALDWSVSTLERRKKRYPEIEKAYQKGRVLAKRAMGDRLWQIAMSNDKEGHPTKGAVVATIFWLKCQAGWKENFDDQVQSLAPEVQIYLPKRDGS